MKIDCLIFSKDRACQLDLLLRSIKDNFEEIHPIILFKQTNENYKLGYEKVNSYHSGYEWIEEESFVPDLRKIVSTFRNQFFLVLVDDEIVIRDYPIKNAMYALELNNDLHCVSLRMNPSIHYTYTADLASPPPTFFDDYRFDDLLFWNWENYDGRTDWGYPSCINSHIYRKEFIIPMIQNLPFNNVNRLEGLLNLQRSSFKKQMACFNKSKTINIANNLIQTGTNRHSNNPEYSVENLNRKFLEGNRISTENFYNYDNNLATLERDYIWLK